jgi:hypothetical protein
MIPTYFQTITPKFNSIAEVPVKGDWAVQFEVSDMPSRIRCFQQGLPPNTRWSLRVRTANEPDSSADVIPSYVQEGTVIEYHASDMTSRPPATARVFLIRRQS